MSRWLDAARKAAPTQEASAISANRAESPPIGTNGTIGTPLKHQSEAGGAVSDNFEERAAIVEYDTGVPREWAEGFAHLCTMSRHPDFTEERWQTLIDDAGRFMDRWARQVAAMGWSTREVFGVGSDKPDARIDVKGLVPCIGGNKVVVVSADSVTIQTHSGNHLRIFRRPDKFSEGRIPIWEVEGDKQRE